MLFLGWALISSQSHQYYLYVTCPVEYATEICLLHACDLFSLSLLKTQEDTPARPGIISDDRFLNVSHTSYQYACDLPVISAAQPLLPFMVSPAASHDYPIWV